MYKKALLVGSLAFLLAMFALSSTSAYDQQLITKKDLKTSRNNLKEIALAFHSYMTDADGLLNTNGHFPVNIEDKDGKPLLSWRVAILPFLEQEELYKQFKLDEPWDSDNNKKLIEKMPKFYAPVRVKAKPGETFYQVFEGENALFGPKKKPGIADLADGFSQTGLVFEGGDPVIWTRPADLHFDKDKPLPKLGGMFDGECLVVMCDGSLIHLKKNPDEQQLKYLIMPEDGNIIDYDKLEY